MTDINLAPICLFVYNRLDETRQTIEALAKNRLASESDLFIYADGPKTEQDQEKTQKVLEFVHSISGFKSVTIKESPHNKGLANSIIHGVDEVLKDYETVIVLEDDLLTSPNFLSFMNEALEFYKNEALIQTVCGFSVAIDGLSEDIFFQRRPFSWGWATWRRYWNKEIFEKQAIRDQLSQNADLLTDFKTYCGNNMGKMLIGSLNNQNDSWFVRWAYNQFREERYSVIPVKSLVVNIGFGKDGTHCKGINPYRSLTADAQQMSFELKAFAPPAEALTARFLAYFSLKNKITVRLKLLKTREGRKLLFEELQEKIK